MPGRAGRPGGAERELARLHEQDPSDRPVLLALADVLRADGRGDEADRVLLGAAAARPRRRPLVRKRAELREADGDLQGAARLLIEATARPAADCRAKSQDVWDRLLRPADPVNRRRLTLRDLQAMPVAAGGRSRPAPRRLALRGPLAAPGAGAGGPGPGDRRPAGLPAGLPRPAGADLGRPVRRRAKSQVRRAEQLCDAAEKAGAAVPGRGAEGPVAGRPRRRRRRRRGPGRGGPAGRRRRPPRGWRAPSAADPARPGADPELQLAFASSYRAFGDDAGFERLLRKLIADHPTFDAAYAALHDYYLEQGDADPGGGRRRRLARRRARPPSPPGCYQARDLPRVTTAPPPPR